MTLDEVLLYVILGCIVAAVVGIGVGYLLRKRIGNQTANTRGTGRKSKTDC